MLTSKAMTNIRWWGFLCLAFISASALGADDGIQFKKSSEDQPQENILVAGWESEKVTFGWLLEIPLLDRPDRVPSLLNSLYSQVSVGELVRSEIRFLPKPEEISQDRLDAQLLFQSTALNGVLDLSNATVGYRSYLATKLKAHRESIDGAALNSKYAELGSVINGWKSLSTTSPTSPLPKPAAPTRTMHAPIGWNQGLEQSQSSLAGSTFRDLTNALQRKDASSYVRASKALRHIINSPEFAPAVRGSTVAQYRSLHRDDGLLIEASRKVNYSRLMFAAGAGSTVNLDLDATELLNFIWLKAGGRANQNLALASLAAMLYHAREGDVPFNENDLTAVATGSPMDALIVQVANAMKLNPTQVDNITRGAIL